MYKIVYTDSLLLRFFIHAPSPLEFEFRQLSVGCRADHQAIITMINGNTTKFTFGCLRVKANLEIGPCYKSWKLVVYGDLMLDTSLLKTYDRVDHLSGQD